MSLSSDLNNSNRSLTPLSITSSSSEEEFAVHSPFCSYDIISSNAASTRSKKVSASAVTIPKIDPGVLGDLEHQALSAANSLTEMTEQFTTDLKAMSQRTSDFTSLYQACIGEAHSAVDANVKTMYSLIAKAEELNGKMAPLYDLGHQIQDIKQMLDTLETMCR